MRSNRVQKIISGINLFFSIVNIIIGVVNGNMLNLAVGCFGLGEEIVLLLFWRD